MTANTRRILYADADGEARLLIQALLATQTLDLAETDPQARRLSRQHSYDVYIVGGGDSGSTALELCAWLHRIDPCTPIVFCSSNPAPQHQQLALEAGVLRYQLKPLDPALLRSTLSLLLKLGQIETQRALLAARQAMFDELIARSGTACEPAQAARAKAQQTLDRILRVKAYRAFRNAGGNRANFERMWPEAVDQAMASATLLGTARSGVPINPGSGSRDKR